MVSQDLLTTSSFPCKRIQELGKITGKGEEMRALVLSALPSGYMTLDTGLPLSGPSFPHMSNCRVGVIDHNGLQVIVIWVLCMDWILC